MFEKPMLAAIAGLLLVGCGGGGGGAGGTGSVSVGVTDAPVDDADAVVVTFTGVQLRGVGEPLTFNLIPPATVDLLSQQGDQQFFLIQDEVIPAGIYDEVRLVVDQENNSNCNQASGNPNYPNYVTVDGVDYPLIVPSGATSGFKIKGPITVAAGGSAAYTVDFDLRKSLAQRGRNNCYNLRPVLRVVDNAQVGTLIGTVDPALLSDASCEGTDPVTGEGAAVYVFQGANIIPDDFDGADAEPLTTALLRPVRGEGDAVVGFDYTVGFLLAGDYTVAFSCNAGADLPDSDDAVVFTDPADADIFPDTTTTVDFVAVPPPIGGQPAG